MNNLEFDESPQGLKESELIEDPLDILRIEELAKQQNEAESDQQSHTPRLEEHSNPPSLAPSQAPVTQFLTPDPRQNVYPQSEITPVIVIQPPPMYFQPNLQPPMTPKMFYPEQQLYYPQQNVQYNPPPQYYSVPPTFQPQIPQNQFLQPQFTQPVYYNQVQQTSLSNPQKYFQNTQRNVPPAYFAQKNQSNASKQPEPIIPNSNIPFTTSQIMINPQPHILRSPESQLKPPSIVKSFAYNHQKIEQSPSFSRQKMETYHSQMITSRPQPITQYSNVQQNLRLSQRMEQPHYLLKTPQCQNGFQQFNRVQKVQSNIKTFQGIQQPPIFPSPQKPMSLIQPVQPQIIPTQHYNSTIRTLFR